MEECEICGRNIEDEQYEEYRRCQECHSTYTDCADCGKHLEYYLVFNNCYEYDLCSNCYTDQRCKRYIEDEIMCTKCSGCYVCCGKVCGKLKKDEIIKLIARINLPDEIIRLFIKFL